MIERPGPDDGRSTPLQAASPEEHAEGTVKKHVGRRRLVKGTIATVAGVTAGAYAPPTLRKLKIPVAYAFSF